MIYIVITMVFKTVSFISAFSNSLYSFVFLDYKFD